MVCYNAPLLGQGKNHQWLLGYRSTLDTSTTSTRSRVQFTFNSSNVIQDSFKMPFGATQANISSENGNLLFVSNGVWIMDASGDTMLNGGGLNPNSFTTDFSDGLPISHGNIILPMPGDSSKYILIHQTGNYNAQLLSTELYFSKIDITQNNGLGSVIQKNIVFYQDTLDWGLAACKHANGRDWWIVASITNSDSLLLFLLTPSGINYINTQTFGLPPTNLNGSQPIFSPDGNKFALTTGYPLSTPGTFYHDIRIFSFDRCSGTFLNISNFSLDNYFGFNTAFSPNSKYLYTSTTVDVYQINTDTSDIAASIKTVATYDGYFSPISPFRSSFWSMYPAANGKIYISSGSSVVDLNCIDQPDSSGLACNVLQHSVHLPCYSFRGNVYHPNYYLGPVIGSACDTLLHVGLQEHYDLIQNFKIYPNPLSNGILQITYLLPQNLPGNFEVFDATGRKVYSQLLPPWSSLESINLSNLNNGVYQCVIYSGHSSAMQKLVVMKD